MAGLCTVCSRALALARCAGNAVARVVQVAELTIEEEQDVDKPIDAPERGDYRARLEEDYLERGDDGREEEGGKHRQVPARQYSTPRWPPWINDECARDPEHFSSALRLHPIRVSLLRRRDHLLLRYSH